MVTSWLKIQTGRLWMAPTPVMTPSVGTLLLHAEHVCRWRKPSNSAKVLVEEGRTAPCGHLALRVLLLDRFGELGFSAARIRSRDRRSSRGVDADLHGRRLVLQPPPCHGDPRSRTKFRDDHLSDAERIRRKVAGTRWRPVDVVSTTGSTNADLAAAARRGAPAGTVLVSSHQSSGRGRFQRVWEAPPDTSVAVSLLLRPAVPVERWGWLSMLAGMAVTDGLREVAGLDAGLKWPNDVLVDGRKICGILSEAVPGTLHPPCRHGINVALTTGQLPCPRRRRSDWWLGRRRVEPCRRAVVGLRPLVRAVGGGRLPRRPTVSAA